MWFGQADSKRATAVGGVGGDAAGDPAGGVAGGGRGAAAGGLGRHAAPGLAAYLLVPRRDAWGKALMAPACFVAAACSTGHFGGWARFTVLWLVLELLIYQARYQWNDIAGVDSDLQHPEAGARSRLPVGSTPQARRRSIGLSWLTAAARILAALLVGWLTGLTGQVLVLVGAVFAIAGSYEWLRASRNRHWTSVRVVAVWLAVGLGYLVRGGLGLSLGGLAAGSAAMVATLVCLGAFGIMFVLLTWALEATSYCTADDDGRWHAGPELAVKPHLAALLRHVAEPLDGAGLPPGASRYCGGDRVLRGGSRAVRAVERRAARGVGKRGCFGCGAGPAARHRNRRLDRRGRRGPGRRGGAGPAPQQPGPLGRGCRVVPGGRRGRPGGPAGPSGPGRPAVAGRGRAVLHVLRLVLPRPGRGPTGPGQVRCRPVTQS